MKEATHYSTITQNGTAEFKDRGSKFLAYAFPIETVNDFKSCMEELKKLHPKANHHCFAYRLGFDQNTFRVSDDGEPSGTAGRPILGQLDSKGITNTLIVVVRYFGGTLLGVPGLINAYKSAASLVLQTTPVTQKPIEVIYNIHFDYTRMNEVMHILKQTNCTVLEKDMNLFCHFTTGIPKSRAEEILFQLKEIQGVDIQKKGA